MSTHKELAGRLREIADRIGNLTGDRDAVLHIADALDRITPPDAGVGLETNAHERDQWRHSVNPFTVEDKERLLRDFNRIVASLLKTTLELQDAAAALAAEKARADEAEERAAVAEARHDTAIVRASMAEKQAAADEQRWLDALSKLHATEARCDTLAGALRAAHKKLSAVMPPGVGVHVPGNWQGALDYAQAIFEVRENTFAALATIPAKPATETKP